VVEAIAERLDEPTARGLARAVGRAVSDGALPPGTRLPPIRALATRLELSPTTVSSAWHMLVRSGTIQTDGRRGTVISTNHAGPARYRRALDHGAAFVLDLSSGTPDPALLPDLRPVLRRIEPEHAPTSYLDPPVLAELEDLLRADWPFPAERFAVVDGAMDALQLIAGSLLGFGDRVAVEQPCFPPLLDLLDSVGAVAVPVRLDDDGPLPADVALAVAANVRALFVQSRAQNPTGASLTAERVEALARALRDSDALVVEDDSSGMVASTPAHSLGSHLPSRTLHVRSYSKSHGPDLRLAAVAGPAELVDQLVDRRFIGQGWTSRLLQSVLVELLTNAESVQAVQYARGEYARRRDEIVCRLAVAGVPVGGKDGMNIWVPVADEPAALLRLAARGIGVLAGEPFWVSNGNAPHIRVTAGLVGTQLPAVAAELADAALAVGSGARR
jgi:DNA-binding transcriptional MocR family regulator